MGAFNGSLTYRQYFVRAPLPDDWRDRFPQRIADFSAKDIDPKGEEERGVGWCSAHFPLDVDLHEGLYLYNDYLALSMRVDTLKVAGPTLKIHAELECRRVIAAQNLESLNRYQRAEIKEQVKLQLRKRILPSIKAVDFVWNLERQTVWFWSGNEKVNVEFQELFEQTFELPLGSDTAYTAAAYGALGVSDEVVTALATLQPSFFISGETGLAASLEISGGR